MSGREMIAAAGALLVAGFVLWRWRRLGLERRAIGIAIVVALAVYASGLLSELPDVKTLIGDIAVALGPWTYLLVGGMAYLETGAFVGLVAPGETVVIAAGVIAAHGEIELFPLIGLVWVCAVLGDTTSFYVGRHLGRPFLERHGPRLRITPERLDWVERYLERHGGKTIVIGRFVGLVRALAPFVAGSSGFPYRRFLPYSVVGTGLWSATFSLVGYLSWRSFDQVVHLVGQATFALGVTVAAIAGIVVAYRRRSEIREWLRRHEGHPLLRPLFAVGRPAYVRVLRPSAEAIAPRLRFLRERITPGELGLELTSALAIASTGMFVFVVYLLELRDSLQPTPLDTELLDLADSLRSDVATDIARAVTHLGALPTAIAVVTVAGVVLAVRRRPMELVVLVLGLALIYVSVHLTKAAVDRPRPADPLIDTSRSAYPSGHAAYATTWVAAAVVAVRRLGLVRHAALVTGALALTAAVGLSRIYLRVHYWSDVVGGWALGFGVLGSLTAIGLIVEHIRNNGARRAIEADPRAEP